MIPISEPFLFKDEKKYVHECIQTGWISSQGKYIKKFEDDFSEYHNTKYCIAVSNCTVALQLALMGLDIGSGDEVICPALTFISPANMILHVGAKLVLVDVNKNDLNINVDYIESKITRKTKAIIAVHQFGSPANMKKICRIAKKHKLFVIEDNAESIGSSIGGKLTGTFGDIATYSFFGNKIISTGEGGMLIVKSKKIFNKIKLLRDHGLIDKEKYIHSRIGFNFRMTNMQAALGCGQLKNLNKILDKKKTIFENYSKFLKNNKYINILPLKTEKEYKCVTWLFTIYIKKINKKNRELLINNMKKNGIDCRRMIRPVADAYHIRNLQSVSHFDVADDFSYKSIHLPSSFNITLEQIKFIAKCLNKELKNIFEK